MRTSRSIMGTVLLVCIMLLGVGPSAVAASGTHDTDDISRLKDTLRLENVTIPWSFPLELDGTMHRRFQRLLALSILSTTATIACGRSPGKCGQMAAR